jgi:hypothetical protein
MTKQNIFLNSNGGDTDVSCYQTNTHEVQVIDESAVFLVLTIEVREDVSDVAVLLPIHFNL